MPDISPTAPVQTVIINNQGQTGGSNIGILNIKTDAPQPRHVSPQEAEAIKKLADGTVKLTISFTIDPHVADGGKYALELASALKNAGYKINPDVIWHSFLTPLNDITLDTTEGGDEENTRRFTELLAKAGIKVTPFTLNKAPCVSVGGGATVSTPAGVMINIGPQTL